jgi:hypothetical protein
MRVLKRIVPLAVTAAVFAVILRRVPIDRLVQAIGEADRQTFLLLMIPNTIFYFCWDTLILTAAIRWFHGPIAYRDLLPVRAASYVVAVFNTNVARGAVAAYLARRLRAPLLPLGSTVIFLLLTEYTHLVAWATLGMALGGSDVPADLLWVPPAVALFWLIFLLYARLGVTPRRVWGALVRRRAEAQAGGARSWAILRTFRLAPAARYAQIIALRAPMFFVSLCLHYFAAGAFGIHIPFVQLVAFLPIIFMLAALPISVAHLGTTQAAWIFFFSQYAPAPRLLAFSLAAHATFSVTRALLGAAFTPWAYRDLVAADKGPAVTYG